MRRFHFTDNALPPAALQALAGAAATWPASAWHGFVRFEAPLAEPALARGLAAAGCRMLQLGLESGSQAVLDRLQKGTDLTPRRASWPTSTRAGIASYVYVLLGTPQETAADAEATLAFLEAHAHAHRFSQPGDHEPAAGRRLCAGALPGAEWQEEPLGLYRPLRRRTAGDGPPPGAF